MAVSPYTLNNLYNQGIIDYVPYDLVNTNIGGMSAQAYMNSAMQGAMYQNHGMMQDQFTPTQTYSNPQVSALGGLNNNIVSNNPEAGMNGFGGINGNTFFNNQQAGVEGFGGGFGKLGAQTSSFVNSIPKSVLGIVSGALVIGTCVLCLKGRKKPPVQKEGFMSKLKFWKKKNK